MTDHLTNDLARSWLNEKAKVTACGYSPLGPNVTLAMPNGDIHSLGLFDVVKELLATMQECERLREALTNIAKYDEGRSAYTAKKALSNEVSDNG